MATTSDKRTKVGQKLDSEIKRLKNKPFVKAGVQSAQFSEAKEERHPEEGHLTTLGEVAVFNEFGIGVPERSFIRAAADINGTKWNSLGDKLQKKILEGTLSVPTALGIVGQKMEADIKNRIRTIRNPPNAPATIEKKKSSNPLIDTGQLLNSIRYIVVTGDKDGDE